MDSVKSSNADNLQCDLLVIGAGGGGLSAAVAAAEEGVKNILVLEARHRPGGNALFPVGIFGAESPTQKRLGIDCSRDEVFKNAMDYAHWQSDPKLLRAWIDKSGDTIRWLEEKGLKFVVYPESSFSSFKGNRSFHFVEGTKNSGKPIVDALIKSCESLGVQILCQIKAKKLLTDNKGKVTGAIAEAKDRELNITAKSVIISTGGIAGNEQLIKKYIPSYNKKEFNHWGLPHMGDGLRMATEVGAATEGVALLEMAGPFHHWSNYIFPIARKGNMVWVNKNGERFADETINVNAGFIGAPAVYRQPDKTAYVMFDNKIKQSIIAEGLSPIQKRTRALSSEKWAVRVDDDLKLQMEKNRVKISDSWDEIAEWMGAKPAVLKHTVDEYNSFCDQGHDEVFVKDPKYLLPLRTPPYYAIQCCIELITARGGIKINPKMEVLNCKGEPIPGLYAAGVDTTSADGDTYDGNLLGHSFGFTVCAGRIAGENAANNIR